jgi:hypothetical protein
MLTNLPRVVNEWQAYKKSTIALRLAAGRAAKRASGCKGSVYPFGWSKGGPSEREQHTLSMIKTRLVPGPHTG